MPVHKCKNDKWRIGKGSCRFETKEKAEKAWKAMVEKGVYGKDKK